MKRSLFILSIALFPAFLAAQDLLRIFEEGMVRDMSVNSEDIRSLGMGQTGVAGMNGSNAIFTNPALIGGLTETKISGGGRVQGGLVNDEEQDYNAHQSNGSYSEIYLPHVKFTHLSLAAPFTIPNSPVKIGAGIGYHTSYDAGANKYTVEKDPFGTIKTTTKNSGGINTISGAFSLGLMDKVFLGFSFNKSILGDFTKAIETKTPDTTTEEKLIFKTSAFYSSLGGMVKLLPVLQIGVSYTSGFDWNLDEAEADDGYFDTTITLNDEVAFPGIFAVGLEYQLVPQLKVAAEYQNRPFGDFDLNNSKLFPRMDNGYAFRGGIELLAGSVPLRAGFFAESVPITDAIPNKNEPKTLLGATAGVGIPMGTSVLDMSIQYKTFSFDTRDVFTSRTFTYTEHVFRFDIGLTMSLGAPDLSGMNMTPATNTGSVRQAQQPAAVAPAPQPAPQPAPVTPAPVTPPPAPETAPASQPSSNW